jgi:two-component system phosphate regulon response regulator PhoB
MAAQRELDAVLPDAILLDWMLPGQSGLVLAKKWRADSRTKAIPILMLTARGDEPDKVAGPGRRGGRLHHQAVFHP